MDTNYSFEIEDYTGQFGYSFFSEANPVTKDMFAGMSAELRKKFLFPKSDPLPNEYVDTRSYEEIALDIERLMSMCLTPDETAVWSEIATRDISHDIHLKSGIRTPAEIVVAEINRYKKEHGGFCPLPVPSSINLSSDPNTTLEVTEPPPTPDPADTIANPSNSPLVDMDEASDVLNSTSLPPTCPDLPSDCETPSHMAKPETINIDSENREQKLPEEGPAKSDNEQRVLPREIDSTKTGVSENVNQQLFTARRQLGEHHEKSTKKISNILCYDDTPLFHKFIFLYNALNDNHMSRKYVRYLKQKRKMSFRLVRRAIRHMVAKGVIPMKFMKPKQKNIHVKLVNRGPIVLISIKNQQFPALIDSGSEYTLIPFQFWSQLNLSESDLDQSQIFNISSATHRTKNSCLGTADFHISLPTINQGTQLVKQHSLVLRESMNLSVILLGDDFLKQNNVHMQYSKYQPNPIVHINDNQLVLASDQAAFKNTLVKSFLANSNTTITIDSYTSFDSQNTLDLDPPALQTTTEPPCVQQKTIDHTPKITWDIVSNFADFSEENVPSITTLSHLGSESLPIEEVTAILQTNRESKSKHFEKNINSFSVLNGTDGERVLENMDKNDIFPEDAPTTPSTDLSHLSTTSRQLYEELIMEYGDIWATHREHRGEFTGFSVRAIIDHNSKISCRQPPRHKVLPPSCVADLHKYRQAGLFELSTGMAHQFCANITLVLKATGKESRDSTKATRNMLKHRQKTQTSATHFPQLSTPDTKTEVNTENPPQASYRATIDFRQLNQVSLNDTTAFLPSIQSIEQCFGNAIVTTLDIKNAYPSIMIEESSRNYFNFYGPENMPWRHRATAQGWSPSLNFCQRALAWTFRPAVLEQFKTKHNLTWQQLPFSSFEKYLISFVDDLGIYTPKQLEHNSQDKETSISPQVVHLNAVHSVLFAIKLGGWKLSLQKCTFSNPIFIFLGLKWNLTTNESMVQNDRIESILNYRVPRSIPELNSRLAQISYFGSYIIALKRISIVLYDLIKRGTWQWKKVHAEAYNNLLFIMALSLKNYIFNPKQPLILIPDTSALETGLSLAQWNPDKLSLQLVTTKSIILPMTIKRQSPVYREAFGVTAMLQLARPYLFSSQTQHNFLFCDASSISYTSRNKHFSSFLQSLAEQLSMYPSLHAIHCPGRVLTFSDLMSRTINRVRVSNDSEISKEHAQITPALHNVKPGTILPNWEILKLINHRFSAEILDCSDTEKKYQMRVNWQDFINPAQMFTSETEFIQGSLLGILNPELVFHYPTFVDIFRLKSKRFKTNLEKLKFIQHCASTLKDLPANSVQLNKLVTFLKQKVKSENIRGPIDFPVNLVISNECCQCTECLKFENLPVTQNSILNPADIIDTLMPFFKQLNSKKLKNGKEIYKNIQCPTARDTYASHLIDQAIDYCTQEEFHIAAQKLLTFYYSFDKIDVQLQFSNNQLIFTNTNTIKLQPFQITDISLNFHSNIVVVPQFEQGNFSSDILLTPNVIYQPCLSILDFSLANPSQEPQSIKENSILFQLSFQNFDQLLGISRDYEKLQNLHQLDSNIFNFKLVNSLSKIVSDIPVQKLCKDLKVYATKSRPAKYHKKNAGNSNEEPQLDKNKDSIFHQPFEKLNEVLQAAKMIDILINRNFGFNNTDIEQLQQHDLKLKEIYDKANTNQAPGFLLKNNILYKKKGQFSLLCAPRILLKQIIKETHCNRNFHFSKHQCNTLLSNLVYHPDLHTLISTEIDSCLICNVNRPKKVYKLIGNRRTTFYAPTECIVMDSAYLPKSRYGYSKLLILVDSATSYTSFYPSSDLKSSTVKRHLLHHLSSHKLPSFISCDLGTEFAEDLSGFLAGYGIQLLQGKPYNKGSTAASEAHIRLVKDSLRQFCLADHTNWPNYLPLISSGLNGLGLYGSNISREMLYFTPYADHGNINLLAHQIPEIIFNHQYSLIKFLSNKRKKRLREQSRLDPTKFYKNCLVLAINHPTSNKNGDSQELQPAARGIYYVKDVQHTHLRLVHIFNGSERTLPKEYCEKIDINDLSLIQSSLKSHQLAKIQTNLTNSNKFLPRNEQKTWLAILGGNDKKYNTDTPHWGTTPPDHAPDDYRESNEQKSCGKNDQVDFNDQPTKTGIKTDEGSEIGRKTTRSGNVYTTVTLPSLTPAITQPGEKSRRVVTFNEVVEICKEGEIFTLPLRQKTDKKNITSFFHLVGLDFSLKELLWKNNAIESSNYLTFMTNK